MRKFYILFFIVLLSLPIWVQGQLKQLSPASSAQLQKISFELEKNYLTRRIHTLERASESGLSVRFQLADGNLMELQYFDEFGLPVYYGTRNAGAAMTTGASQLHSLGSLRLFVSGRQMVAGIWDGGSVEATHDELVGGVNIKDGSVVNNHATHVAGTLIARGVSHSARGMAPQAGLLSYDWNNDLSEMAAEASKGLLLSNHSYGTVLGWNWNSTTSLWQWMAHKDSLYDYRFGYYSNTSRTLDKIAFDAPHYLIVWAAGNDRNDSGDGTRPPDGPYDIIGPEGVAKNVLAVGAAHKMTGTYSGPQSVTMSHFSSWGPTDDGRIKPDLVGAGVGLLSSISGNAYATYSGTSMAAPNVTGSLLLLQQLYKEAKGDFLKAATLKGIAIHTAREAGSYPGPDYQFGWGLLDAEKAARMILHQDETDFVILESSLNSGDVYQMEFQADATGEIVATISWTDPPGSPVPAALNPTDIMLVNDLDVRIIKMPEGTEFFPWILNGQEPASAAGTGDNIRDNIERINISAPEPGNYVLRISHKGSLRDGKQDFSLILQTRDVPARKTLYWVGNEGDWSDGNNWSLSSGGEPAGLIPGSTDHVLFDQKSFPDHTGEPMVVNIHENAWGYSFHWLSNKNAHILSDGQTLDIKGSFFVAANAQLELNDLNIQFTGSERNYSISLPLGIASQATMIFDGEGSWKLIADLEVNKLWFKNGDFSTQGKTLVVKEILTEPGYAQVLDIQNSILRELQNMQLFSPTLGVQTANSVIHYGQEAVPGVASVLQADGHAFHHLVSEEGSLEIIGNHEFNKLSSGIALHLSGNNHFGELMIASGTNVLLAQGSQQTIGSDLSIVSLEDQPVYISSDGPLSAMIEGLSYQKYCFDYLILHLVEVKGESIFNAGLHSQVDTQSIGWLTQECDQVLFSDFNYRFACVNGITHLIDMSTGAIENWAWELTKSSGTETLYEKNPVTTYTEKGYFPVSLTISNILNSHNFSQEIFVRDNNLTSGNIVFSDSRYTSESTAPYYQWFLNSEPIPGAIFRTFDNFVGLNGVFHVLLSNDVCNILSQPLLVVSTEERIAGKEGLNIFPNPAVNSIQIQTGTTSPGHPRLLVTITDMTGRLQFSGVHEHVLETIRVDNLALPTGVYVIAVHYGAYTKSAKLIIGN